MAHFSSVRRDALLNVKRVGQGVERQLIETRTGLEGLVGKALTLQALQRLRAIHTLLSGLASPVFYVASCKAVLDCAHITKCAQRSVRGSVPVTPGVE